MTDHAGETARIAHTACPHSGVLQTPCCACLDERIAAALTQQHAALVGERDALRWALLKHACYCGPGGDPDWTAHREDCPYRLTLTPPPAEPPSVAP